MMRHLPEDEDARLEVLFSGAAERVSDAGFSEQVMRRVALLVPLNATSNAASPTSNHRISMQSP